MWMAFNSALMAALQYAPGTGGGTGPGGGAGNGGYGYGGGWAWGWWFWVFWAAIIFLLFWFVLTPAWGRRRRRIMSPEERILREQFARGEITRSEFEARMSNLRRAA